MRSGGRVNRLIVILTVMNAGCEDPARYIGCCGAYCKTCRALAEGTCRGCKPGYDKGERDIRKARCRIKVCCFGEKKFETCADCPDYDACDVISVFHNKKGYKYIKYHESLEFIRKNGYDEFIEAAGKWKGAYGRLPRTLSPED
ncbi:hypothetical protein Mpet_0438 [Methanolacinia petrolearia DSM 11571]|uniref:DUF3795 domain-containing protein n=1 Tax=Methanolacinia petrolearia (strain DSM 11571 / OCM 486 / SEBR 4847) TaxID=679926 RepID=E1RGK1_METP4|nr:DUF3795 domain-containing protein [Methanolacinia petrolearia]ADN35212.1 hypothetical protein Mpet_0438 [Methanolacinia petrolearia DSM 11571]